MNTALLRGAFAWLSAARGFAAFSMAAPAVKPPLSVFLSSIGSTGLVAGRGFTKAL
jgi:hypothetical protein